MIELVVVYPDLSERVLRFERDEVTIGRRPENDVVLSSPSVSSRHARVYVSEGQVWVEDLRSTNGTGLNGNELFGAAPLGGDDIVSIDTFKISLWQPSEPTSYDLGELIPEFGGKAAAPAWQDDVNLFSELPLPQVWDRPELIDGKTTEEPIPSRGQDPRSGPDSRAGNPGGRAPVDLRNEEQGSWDGEEDLEEIVEDPWAAAEAEAGPYETLRGPFPGYKAGGPVELRPGLPADPLRALAGLGGHDSAVAPDRPVQRSAAPATMVPERPGRAAEAEAAARAVLEGAPRAVDKAAHPAAARPEIDDLGATYDTGRRPGGGAAARAKVDLEVVPPPAAARMKAQVAQSVGAPSAPAPSGPSLAPGAAPPASAVLAPAAHQASMAAPAPAAAAPMAAPIRPPSPQTASLGPAPMNGRDADRAAEPVLHEAAVLPSHAPPVPRSFEETGLKRAHLVDLILKTVYFAGEISGYDLAGELKLSFSHVLDPIIVELRRDKLIEVKGGGSSFGPISMIYTITNRAADQVQQILDRNRYVGPAPVPMDTYLKVARAQSLRSCRVRRRQLARALRDMVLEDAVLDCVGPALNSGTAMLLYGPPGNGKSLLCQRLIDCYPDAVLVPYAIEVDGQIIKVFDEHTHQPVPLPEPDAELSMVDAAYDRRFVLCRRPFIMVGGELSLDMLDMRYVPEARYYEAPFQMKANGGILMIDDLGRQKISPRELLNRWIVPLESEVDLMTMATGKKIAVPFDVFVVFATNLDPAELVDDAFLRRVRYKVEIRRPKPDRFKEIFVQACAARKIAFDDEGYTYLIDLYRHENRPFNACEPRNLLDAVQALAAWFEAAPQLKPELLERAYRSYFTRPRSA